MIFRVFKLLLGGIKKTYPIPPRNFITPRFDLVEKNVISFPTTEPLDAIGV